MNAAVRSGLLLEPRPAAADDVRVTRVAGAWRVCWITGKDREAFGPPFAQVSDATAAARLVREAHGL